jgi:hypothetical protein
MSVQGPTVTSGLLHNAVEALGRGVPEKHVADERGCATRITPTVTLACETTSTAIA